MTCHVEREPTDNPAVIGKLKSVSFSCDHAGGCDVVAFDKDIPVQGGLIRTGWECHGGKHYCPKHRTDTKGEK